MAHILLGNCNPIKTGGHELTVFLMQGYNFEAPFGWSTWTWKYCLLSYTSTFEWTSHSEASSWSIHIGCLSPNRHYFWGNRPWRCRPIKGILNGKLYSLWFLWNLLIWMWIEWTLLLRTDLQRTWLSFPLRRNPKSEAMNCSCLLWDRWRVKHRVKHSSCVFWK